MRAWGVKYGLQPALLIAALLAWLPHRDRPELFLFAVVVAQIVLGVLEHYLPARADWVQSPREKAVNVALVVGFTACAGAVTALYRDTLAEPLGALRAQLGLGVWPTGWPLAARIALAFFASELIWYGIHRSEHHFKWLWRISGHGLHHSFQRLNAINFNANHPLEAFWILMPATLLALVFGAGEEVGAAVLLVGVNASVAHANLTLNTRGIGWLLTTNAYHLRHHSRVFEESNTNYGCAAIVWDRVFGTFAPELVRETGIGPSEPRLWDKLLLPLRQPDDVTVAP